LQLVYFYLEF